MNVTHHGHRAVTGGARTRRTAPGVGGFLCLAALAGAHAAAPAAAQQARPPHAAGVEIVAVDYAFEAPDRIPSGWTSIDFANDGEESHFLLLTRIPDGRTYDEYSTQVLVPFDAAWRALREGEITAEQVMERLGAALPEWFWASEFAGGAGIVPAGGRTSVTVHLEPGTYVIECYMKTGEGELHNVEGMFRELVVTEESSGRAAPEADIRIRLSNGRMDIEGDLSPGRHVVAVEVLEDPENTFGHNVHVATELREGTDEVIRWMNFLELDGLGPEMPATFAGGMHLLPAGRTGYFALDLAPGRYLFLSEYTAATGVLMEVVVDP